MKHIQLGKNDLPTAIRNTDTFKSFAKSKQGLTIRLKNTDRLYDYYAQACKHGIAYLKQNPNIFANDVRLIEEIINS